MARDQTLTTKLVVEDEASEPTEDYAKILDKLDGETATVELALQAAGVQGELEDLLVQIADLDSNDPEIDVKLEQAAAAKKELDGLQSTIKEINATDVDIQTKPATKGIKDLGTEADNSRSVMANMTGNTAAELGEVAGISGTAGQALGQLGEYAAEGDISLSGLAKVAGPMAALTIVTYGLARNQEKQAAAAKAAAEEMDNLASVADEMIGVTFSKLILKTLESGQSLDDMFQTLADGNIEAARRTLEWAEATGQSAEIVDHLTAAIDEKSRADAQAKKTSEDFGTAQDDAAGATGRQTKALQDQKPAVDTIKKAYDDLKGALDFEQATLNFQQAMQDAQTKVAEGTTLSKQDLHSLKEEYLRIAEDIGLSPIEVQSNLDRIDRGEVDQVYWDTQQQIDQKGPVKIKLEVAAASIAKGVADINRAVSGGVSGKTTTQVINVNLPRGARSSDISRAMSAHTRRAGRRYGSPVVTRAR